MEGMDYLATSCCARRNQVTFRAFCQCQVSTDRRICLLFVQSSLFSYFISLFNFFKDEYHTKMMSVTNITRINVLPFLRKSTKIQSTASLSSLVKLEEKQGSYCTILSTSCCLNIHCIKSHETGYAVVSMHKPPVNSLSLEMIQALSQSLSELEKNKCKGIILTSVFLSCWSSFY